MSKKKDNKQTVSKLLTDMQKQFGEKVVSLASDKPTRGVVYFGEPTLDMITGGMPINRIFEMYGPMSALKSYFGYKQIANFQQTDFSPIVGSKDMFCALIDVEGTYTREWGEKNFGIDNDKLILVQPSTLEEAIDTADFLIQDESVSFLMFDSMHSVGASGEVDKSMEDEQMGLNARFWNKATRKINSAMNKNKANVITVYMINGSYDKVGFVMGDPDTVKNGSGLKYAKSVSVRSKPLKELKGEDLENGLKDTVIGRNIKFKNFKNKVGRSFLEGEIFFSFINDGIYKRNKTDIIGQVVEMGVKFGHINQSGAWFDIDGNRVQGMEKLKNVLADNDSLYDEVFDKIYTSIRNLHDHA